jgi:hypothetical protein
MKATSLELDYLKRRIANAVSESRLNRREIGETSDVHPSQVSRICRGDFKTISHNVVQVCKTLGIAIDRISIPAGVEDASWSRIEASARSVWDKSPEGAEKIARILTTIGELRSG